MNTLQVAANPSPAKMWLRALELTAPIPDNPNRIFPNVVEELAVKFGGAPALLAADESLSYCELAERSNQYARWALDHGLLKGEVVCLLMPNCPEYMAIWLGITRIGGIVALLIPICQVFHSRVASAALSRSSSSWLPDFTMLW